MTNKVLWFLCSKGTLVPADEECAERMQRVKDGALVMVSARTSRNPVQHRLLWHLARLVADNSDDFLNAEHVVEQIKIGTGLTDNVLLRIPGVGDVIQMRGRSIAFESMPQMEFEEWFERALDYVVTDLLPLVSREEVVREIERKAIGNITAAPAARKALPRYRTGQRSTPEGQNS